MVVLSPPRVLGATGQRLSARLLRLTDAAKWRPSGSGVGVLSGLVAGPAGSVGELSLVNATTLNVNPFFAVIQGTRSATQGAYEVPNDALVTLAVTGQDASLYRRSLVVVGVDDSEAAGVASSATTDRARLYILDGPLSSTTPAPLPALPPDSLDLGEISIPPTGQTVTLTPYNPRTGARSGILPVFNDTSTRPGHGAATGAHVGQYRDHPTRGLERWDGNGWVALASGSDAAHQVATGASISLANATTLRLPLANVQSSTPDVTAAADNASWTLNRAGVWLLACGYRVAAVGTGGLRYALSIGNADASVIYRQTDSVNVANQPFDIAMSQPIRFPAGQTISALAFTNGGASAIDTVAAAAARTFFTAAFLRA